MKKRDTYAALAVIVGSAVVALSAIGFWSDRAATAGSGATTSQSPNSTTTAPTKPSERVRPWERVRPGPASLLHLPSLGVTAPVTPIGLDGSRTLIPPNDYTTVGWWAQGAEPGSRTGTAIIAGHTVHTGGGALDNLEQMQVGDRVVLSRAAGTLSYTVSSVRTYHKGYLASNAAKVFTQAGPGRLAVITCEDWNGTTYLSNVVVIASNPTVVDSS